MNHFVACDFVVTPTAPRSSMTYEQYQALPIVNTVAKCRACECGTESEFYEVQFHYVEIGEAKLPAVRKMCGRCDFMWTERCKPRRQSANDMKANLAAAARTAPYGCENCAEPS